MFPVNCMLVFYIDRMYMYICKVLQSKFTKLKDILVHSVLVINHLIVHIRNIHTENNCLISAISLSIISKSQKPK